MFARNQLESEIRHTILQGNLTLHYQPQVNQDGEVFGAEALVRWPHPRKVHIVTHLHGVGFSMDDFGTGYSSLAYLQRMPLDQLKIDQAFVRDLLTNPNAAAIARTLVNLGQDLGLKVIAEGVETQEQRAFLSSIGCHAFQGYLYSKALPIAEFDAFARSASKAADQAPLPCKAVLSPPQRAAFVGKTSTAPV